MTRISVCIPAYNGEATLTDAIESVIMQGEVVDEIIIVNDCSTDKTLEIAQSFSSKDSRISVFNNQSNLGLVGNWNRCISLARNEFIAILHGDDRYCKGILLKQMEVFSRNEIISIVFTLANFIDDHGNRIGGTTLPARIKKYKDCCGLEEVIIALLENHNSFITCDSALFKKSMLLKAGGFLDDYRQVMDLDMWLRMLENSPVAFLEERLIDYRKSPNQATSKYHDLRVDQDDFIDLMQKWVFRIFGPEVRPDLVDAYQSFEKIKESDCLTRYCNAMIMGKFKLAASMVGMKRVIALLFKPHIFLRVFKGMVKMSLSCLNETKRFVRND